MAVEPLTSEDEVFFVPYTDDRNYFDGSHTDPLTLTSLVIAYDGNSAGRAYPDERRVPMNGYLPDGFPGSALNAVLVPNLSDLPDPPLLRVAYMPEFTGFGFFGFAVPIPIDTQRGGYVYDDGVRALCDEFFKSLPVHRRGINRLRSGYSTLQCYFHGVDAYQQEYYGLFLVPA
jgi:hypothetical protein